MTTQITMKVIINKHNIFTMTMTRDQLKITLKIFLHDFDASSLLSAVQAALNKLSTNRVVIIIYIVIIIVIVVIITIFIIIITTLTPPPCFPPSRLRSIN